MAFLRKYFIVVLFGVFFFVPLASAQVCTNVPLYSLLCPSDNTGLTADTPSVLVAEAENCSVPAGSAPKCEHYCDATHEKSGNTCAFRSDKPLTVTKNGSGRVTSSPTGIDCGTTCLARFQNGTSVTLTATPNASATFTGWSGACSGSGTTTCTVVMSEKRQVTANFSGPGGTCEDTEGQICSANCSNESGYEAGGTGTCTDTAKPQCCKPEKDPGDGTTTACSGSENAGLVPCGRSCDNTATPNDETKICTLCHLLLLIQNITDWIFMVMTYIAFAVLVAMGILYIVSTGKPQLTGMAKSGIWAALVGFAIVLLGWVAINVILMVLADGALGSDTASFAFKTNGKWFEYNCDTQTRYTGTGGTGTGGGSGGGGGGGGGGGPGNGSCSVITSGYCTTENLGKACSWNAEAASKVCNKESQGNTAAASLTDRCQNENGDKFSFGLFQLNIIANGCMLGSDCCWQNVFSLEDPSKDNGGKKKWCKNSKGTEYVCGWGCTVINRAKYDECARRAMDPTKNISAACTLYKQSGWSPWPVTRRLCGL